MSDTLTATENFLTTFENLREYCNESISELQLLLVKRNQAILELIKSNSNQLNPKIRDKILEAATIQKKVDIFQMTMNYVDHILANFNHRLKPTMKFPDSFESVLWLVSQFKTSGFLEKVEACIENLYGKETLSELKQFTHIKLDSLKANFCLKFGNVFVREYVYILHKLYNTLPKEQSPEVLDPLVTKKSPSSPSKESKDLNDGIDDNKPSRDPDVSSKEEISIPQTASVSVGQECNINSEDQTKAVQPIETKQSAEKLQIAAMRGVDTENLDLYNKIQSTLIAMGKKFTDTSFPPLLSCIVQDVSQFADAKKIVWRRIPEVYKDKKLTLCEQIGPDDIFQGKLKNCFFLSALSVLSEHKHFIKRLFHSNEISPTGCYPIWLCDSGEWKSFLIDDYIPCLNNKNNEPKPYFSFIKGNDIWVLLLEKAYAKLSGYYFNLQFGYQAEAYHALTGAPVKSFKQKEMRTNSMEEFWQFITKNLENKFVVTASCRDDEPSLNNEGVGLVSLHAYAILDAKEVQLPDGKTDRIIKIRNPWGYQEWTGRWGDKSPCWTPELMKALNYQPESRDGTFWMSLEDADKHFYQAFTCQIHSDYEYFFIRLGEKKRKQRYFRVKMTVSSPGFVYLGVHQKVRRYFGKNSGYKYSYVRIILAQMTDGKMTSFLQGRYDFGQNIVLEQNFEKGTYLVFLEVEWGQEMYDKLNLSAYSSVEVEFIEEPIEDDEILPFYQDVMKLFFANKDNQFKHHDYPLEKNNIELCMYEVTRFGLGVILYSNKEKDIDFYTKLNLSRSKNMKLLCPNKEESVFELAVPGGQELMVIMKAINYVGTAQEYCFFYNENYRIKRNYTEEQLKELCQQKGRKVRCSEDGTVEIYRYKYSGGLAFYYVNRGSEMTFREEFAFKPYDCLINQEEKSSLKIELLPGKDLVLDIRGKRGLDEGKYHNISETIIAGKEINEMETSTQNENTMST